MGGRGRLGRRWAAPNGQTLLDHSELPAAALWRPGDTRAGDRRRRRIRWPPTPAAARPRSAENEQQEQEPEDEEEDHAAQPHFEHRITPTLGLGIQTPQKKEAEGEGD